MSSCPAAWGIRCVKPSSATVSPSWTSPATASASVVISATGSLGYGAAAAGDAAGEVVPRLLRGVDVLAFRERLLVRRPGARAAGGERAHVRAAGALEEDRVDHRGDDVRPAGD